MDLYRQNFTGISEYAQSLTEWVSREYGQCILDLGCGNGELSYELTSDGADVLGIDMPKGKINCAEEKFPYVDFIAMNIEEIKFKEQFDTVFSNDILHCVTNQKSILKKIYRALKSNGHLVCSLGAAGNLKKIEDTYKKMLKKYGVEYINPYYFPSVGQYATLLEDVGFKLEMLQSFDETVPLGGGFEGMEDLIRQFFVPSIKKLDRQTAQSVISDTISKLKPFLWDGEVWFAEYKSLKIKAKK